MIGFGVRFGSAHAYAIGYRFEHVSNADIDHDNDGINLHLLRFAWRLR